MFDETGVQTWGAELDIFGSVKNLLGDRNDCPFRYPGQYEDCEIGLYYNRFRYYDPEVGGYVSQDPIGLLGKNPTLYGFVKDSNNSIDEFGLSCKVKLNPTKKFMYSKGGRLSVLKHILTRHRLKSKYSDVSRFLTDSPKQIVNIIEEGIDKGIIDKSANSITVTFKKVIGKDIDGNLTNKLIIFFDEKGWVRTAFPL
jgi:RHS repeat-associated protein